eukprot:3119996-Pyramimonas_sp.AAC.1
MVPRGGHGECTCHRLHESIKNGARVFRGRTIGRDLDASKVASKFELDAASALLGRACALGCA